MFFVGMKHVKSLMRLLTLLMIAMASADRDPSSPAVGIIPGRRLSESAVLHRTPVFGSIHEFAYYFADLLVGTPPQIQSVIVDSGSSILAFTCSTCVHCGKHIDVPFQIGDSSSSEWLKCDDKRCFSNKCTLADGVNHCSYSQNYSEGSSLFGHYISEYIGLNKPERLDPGSDVNMVRYDYVGCHTKETNLFTTQKASGIMGIAFPKDGKQASAMDALFRDPDVNTRVVSICLSDDGGLMSVGGYDAEMHTAPISWTKVTSHQAYQVDVQSISVNGEIVSGRMKRAIVDSGTTYSYIPPHSYSAFFERLAEVCRNVSGCHPGFNLSKTCYVTSAKTYDVAIEELDRLFPHMEVVFADGTRFLWRPRSYFYSKGSAARWCVAIDNNYSSETVLGMSFLKNNDIIFDRDNNQIGLAHANCPLYLARSRLGGTLRNHKAVHVEASPLSSLATVGLKDDAGIDSLLKNLAYFDNPVPFRSSLEQNSSSGTYILASIAAGLFLIGLCILCARRFWRNPRTGSVPRELELPDRSASNTGAQAWPYDEDSEELDALAEMAVQVQP